MMKTEYAIIIDLVRCSLANKPTNAVTHQINRLHEYYKDIKNKEMEKEIYDLINPEKNDENNFKIVRSQS